METSFDIIIIGSGMGALSCASLLSKFGNKKVLILEQHFKPGGFTHTFKREGRYLWDVGVHYIGDLQKGSTTKKIFDIITENRLEWNKMPEPFEKFVYPELTFSLYGSEKQYIQDLIELFPSEKNAILKYFKDIKTVVGWASTHFTLKALPEFLEKAAFFLNQKNEGNALITTQSYLDKTFEDPLLKAVLTSQWGDYGLPPSKSAFVIHALIVNHYLNGGYYPKGGSARFVETIKPVIEAKGGTIKVSAKVTEILVKNYKAIGVKVLEKKGKNTIEKEYFAPIIISDAGAYTTYNQLLNQVEIPFSTQLNHIEPGVSSLTLYLGLKEYPEFLNVKGENYWLYSSSNHEDNFSNKNQILDGSPSMAYLSFPSLKDSISEEHTAEIITFVDYSLFEKWKDLEWKNRGTEYENLKSEIADRLIDYVDQHLHGFKDLVDYKELSTPITNEFFTGHRMGSIYGIPCTPSRFRLNFLSPKTPIENLFLTGADACSPGIVGAMMGGVSTAALVLDLPALFKLGKEMF